jgi:hypothetical protein
MIERDAPLPCPRFSLGTWAALAWLLLQPIVFHWHALISRTAYMPYDLPGFHTPLASVVVEALRQHRLPLWNPYIYGGYPIHADIHAQILYPLAWPAFLRAALWREQTVFYWLEWETALHIALAGLFTWWLLRRCGCGRWAALFGATVYQLGCFFSAQVQHLGAVCGAAWMPLVWLAVMELARGFTRRWFALLAGSLAMSFLAGYPATTLVVYGSALVVSLGFWLARRAEPWLPLWTVLAMAASAMLAAAQLVPSVLWNAHSVASQRWMWSSGGGIPPQALLTTVFPDWFHVLTPEQYHFPFGLTFMYLYNGQAALWLALLALFLRTRLPARLFAVLAAVFALIMLGRHVPGYTFLFGLLPRVVRGAAYIEFTTAAFSLALALAAACALERLAGARRVWIAAALTVLTSIELIAISSNRMMNATQGDWRRVDSARMYFESEDILKQLHAWLYATMPPARTDTMQHEYRFVTVASVVRLPSFNGDNPLAPIRTLEYRKLFSKGFPWERFWAVNRPSSPLLAAANVDLLLEIGDQPDEARMRQAGWDRIPWELPIPLAAWRNRNVLPRYYLVPEVRSARSLTEATHLLAAADPRREAVVEGLRSWKSTAAGTLPPVEVLSYRPERIRLRTTAAQAAYLVIAESWAPGWQASVDSRPARSYPTNVAFQGLPLAAGTHDVLFEYVPKPAYAAFAISVLAWLALAHAMRRRRRSAAPPPQLTAPPA